MNRSPGNQIPDAVASADLNTDGLTYFRTLVVLTRQKKGSQLFSYQFTLYPSFPPDKKQIKLVLPHPYILFSKQTTKQTNQPFQILHSIHPHNMDGQKQNSKSSSHSKRKTKTPPKIITRKTLGFEPRTIWNLDSTSWNQIRYHCAMPSIICYLN